MLPKTERLRFNGLFQQAYEKGKNVYSENLRITFTKTRAENKNKLPLVGFVVSKKFSKKAVIRNRFKRKLREIYRLFRSHPQNANSLKAIGLLVIAIKNSSSSKINFFDLKNLEKELFLLLENLITKYYSSPS